MADVCRMYLEDGSQNPDFDRDACESAGGSVDDSVPSTAPSTSDTGTDTSSPALNDNGLFGGIDDPAAKKKTFSIPGNFIQDINDIADQTGIDSRLLAAVIYQKTRWRKADMTESNISNIVNDLLDTYSQMTTPSGTAQAKAGGRFIPGTGGGVGSKDGWINAAASYLGIDRQNVANLVKTVPTTAADLTYGISSGGGGGTSTRSDIQDVYDYFQQFLGRSPANDAEAQKYVGLTFTALRTALEQTPEGQMYRQYGDAIKAIKEQATSLWRTYIGRDPTIGELTNAVKSGLTTTDKIENWLQQQPYGPMKTTLGTYSSVRQAALQYAQQYLGRNPDSDGKEINWLISQGFTRPEQISAFYEQLKQRQTTGDPNFSWVGNPDQWKKTQSEMQSVWQQEGLTGEVDPHFVNQAITGNWTNDQMKSFVDRQPAPGFPQGVTVGEINRVRSYAEKWKEHYLPGQQLTDPELMHFLSMSSEEVQGYYRQMPLTTHIDALRQGQQTAQQPMPQQQSTTTPPPATQQTQSGGTPIKLKSGQWTTADASGNLASGMTVK